MTADYPAAANNDSVTVTRNGLLQSVTDRAQITTSYTFDSLGRRTGVTDGRGNTTTTAYNSAGQVDYVEDASGNRTTYEYFDPNDADAGRIEWIANDSSKKTRYDYDTHGRVTHMWGDVPHPVSYEYDSTFGQKTKVHTYREGSGWTGTTWPSGTTGDADTTEFTFDSATGLLTQRTNALDEDVDYTYTTDGKLSVRNWARQSGGSDITTTYDYSDGSTGTGELEEIDYSDSTPDVTYSYTRSGSLDEVTDAVGTRAFGYDSYGQRQYETFDPNDIFDGKRITTDYYYQVSYGSPMPTLFTFKGLENIGIGPVGTTYGDYRAEYDFDHDTKRIEKVSRHAVTSDGVEYTYRSDAHLIDQIDFKGSSSTIASVLYSYESDRDLITEVKNIWGSDPNDPNNIVSQYTYNYNDLGLVTSVVREGDSSFGAFANDHHDYYSHNNRLEVTKAKRYNNTAPPSTTNEASTYHRQFVLDNAGNWDFFKPGTDPNTPYSTNALNMYASIDDPSDPNTATETFTYDLDGNLTEDGTFEYTYDAENRLIEVIPVGTPASGDVKLVFKYDYLNRRVEKIVYDWDPEEGASGDWATTASLDRRFIYHDRLLLLELDGLDSNARVRKYVYGPGTDGRLGGPNSLLAIRDADSSTNYVCFNNGTGSVVQLIDRDDGSVDAKYVYDTRGDTVRNTGTYADDNPLRYKTWHCDDEFDYDGTDCDGMCCAADGSYYLSRLGGAIESESAHVPGFPAGAPFDSSDSPGSFLSASCCSDFFTAYHIDGLEGEYFRERWCRDCGIGGYFHSGQICYRQPNCPWPSCHVCFPNQGGEPDIHSMHCDDHVDYIGPACSTDSDGCCTYEFHIGIVHLIADWVIPEIWEIIEDNDITM